MWGVISRSVNAYERRRVLTSWKGWTYPVVAAVTADGDRRGTLDVRGPAISAIAATAAAVATAAAAAAAAPTATVIG